MSPDKIRFGCSFGHHRAGKTQQRCSRISARMFVRKTVFADATTTTVSIIVGMKLQEMKVFVHCQTSGTSKPSLFIHVLLGSES